MMIFTLKKHYIGKKILSFIKFIGFEFTCCADDELELEIIFHVLKRARRRDWAWCLLKKVLLLFQWHYLWPPIFFYLNCCLQCVSMIVPCTVFWSVSFKQIIKDVWGFSFLQSEEVVCAFLYCFRSCSPNKPTLWSFLLGNLYTKSFTRHIIIYIQAKSCDTVHVSWENIWQEEHIYTNCMCII